MIGAGQVLGGAASGASLFSTMGFMPGVGAALGVIAGLAGASEQKGAQRANFRINRQQEFRRNQQLRLQASRQTQAGGYAIGAANVAASGGNIGGASVSTAATAMLIQAARQRMATLAGVSYDFQKGSWYRKGRNRMSDEKSVYKPAPSTRAIKASLM